MTGPVAMLASECPHTAGYLCRDCFPKAPALRLPFEAFAIFQGQDMGPAMTKWRFETREAAHQFVKEQHKLAGMFGGFVLASGWRRLRPGEAEP